MFNDLIEIEDVVISNYYDVYNENEENREYSVIPIKRLKNGDILALEFTPYFEGVGKYFNATKDSGMYSSFYEFDIDARYQRLSKFFRYVFQGKKIDIS